MEILKNVVDFAIALLILYMTRKPIWRFIKSAGQNAYNRAVAWVGGIILVIIVGFLIILFNSR